MESRLTLNPIVASLRTSQSLGRYAPEPRNRLGFDTILDALRGVTNGAAGLMPGIQPEYLDLLNQQIETQKQLQLVSMSSNIEKSKHETNMSTIRNMRVA